MIDSLDLINTLFQVEWEEYGRAIGHFLIAGSARGARVDFSKRNLCGIGHSMGAVSL